jgi:hypothetical protein
MDHGLAQNMTEWLAAAGIEFRWLVPSRGPAWKGCHV